MFRFVLVIYLLGISGIALANNTKAAPLSNILLKGENYDLVETRSDLGGSIAFYKKRTGLGGAFIRTKPNGHIIRYFQNDQGRYLGSGETLNDMLNTSLRAPKRVDANSHKKTLQLQKSVTRAPNIISAADLANPLVIDDNDVSLAVIVDFKGLVAVL